MESGIIERPTKSRSWAFASMSQCSSFTGIPYAKLKSAKDGGCPAFRQNNSVDLIEFLRWYFTDGGKIEALDLNTEKAKNLRLQNNALEREEQVAIRELIPLAEVERDVWENSLMPLAQALDAMPETLASLVNPSDADHAKKVLIQWREKMKKSIREMEVEA